MVGGLRLCVIITRQSVNNERKIMKIKLVSDLHLEFSDINIKNDDGCDVLILGGDIMIAEELYDHPASTFDPWTSGAVADLGRKQERVQRFRDFLKRVSFQFPHVIYIAGNHEFYHGKWERTLKVLHGECAKFPNVYFLEQESKTIDDVTFIGGTLWTDMNKGDPLTLHAVRDMMSDFRVILKENEGYTRLKPADTCVRHVKMLQYIRTVVAEQHDRKFVVVGHHSPSKLSTHEQYANEHLMNGAYSSDLTEFIMDHPQIKLWTHGHTHHPFDYVVGETRIVCNPRGYEGYEPDSGWDPNIVIEV
jgi:Icc-related predicted phosphoesterase